MKQAYHYVCQKINACTHNISLITLLPLSEKIAYQAGQYVEVLLNNGTYLALSIANMPNADGLLEIHLRHDENHPLAQQFMHELKHKKQIRLYGPKGNCTLTRASNVQELIFVAGGTGFGPINALLEDALYHGKSPGKIALYWGIRRPADAYKATLLQKWQKEFKCFNYEIVLSEPSDFLSWQGPTGLVHEYVAHQLSDFNQICMFASGPYPMIKAAHALFCQHGLASDRFFSDIL
ncbi:MAG: hypothetical protein JSS07_02855 [Proteobacteria bacterium]|nr:hypothetical protein [Pseudomonadota bacterium]